MSSLKDIMDVDVEPLESQAIQRSREIALQRSQVADSRLAAHPVPKEEEITQPSMRRKRSHRVTKSSSSGITPWPVTLRRRSSGATEFMESPGYGQSASSTGSSPKAMRPSLPRGFETEPTVRYTPVTGRISRAKKGQPVHICDLCEEPRAFTRAEHLRRHQLSHQQARLPCTFQDCEKAFHRPDLLARHMNRHETQGEKPYKSSEGGRMSRSSSTSSNPRTPPPKFTLPASNMEVDSSNFTSPSIQAPTGVGENIRMAKGYEPIMGPFQAINVSNSSSHQPQSRGTEASDTLGHQPSNTADPMSSPNAGSPSNFRSVPLSGSMPADFLLTHQPTLGPAFQHSAAYQSLAPSVFASPTTPPDLPLLTLQVPDHSFPPSLPQTNSPPYNSSESTWSTPSDISSWPRDRAPLAIPSNPVGAWADTMTNPPPQFVGQNMHHQPSLGIMPESFEGQYAAQDRHYGGGMGIYQAGGGHAGGEEDGGGVYQDGGSQSRDYQTPSGQFLEDRFYWWT